MALLCLQSGLEDLGCVLKIIYIICPALKVERLGFLDWIALDFAQVC